MATVAAAIADPMVEFASNAGWFGPGHFTDHSNLDAIPALIAGTLLLAVYAGLKVRAAIASPSVNVFRAFDRACTPALPSLLPVAYAIQLVALFAMESCEQELLWGHLGGSTLWLGGPIAISLGVHALVCALVAIAAATLVKALGATTLRAVALIRTLLRARHNAAPTVGDRLPRSVTFVYPTLARRGIGERAPPVLQA